MVTVNPDDRPVSMARDGDGFPLPQATVQQDRTTLTALLDVTAGNLTTDFTGNASSEVNLSDVGQLALWVEWTKGSATSLEIEVRARKTRAEAVNHAEVSLSVASGVATINPLTYTYAGASDNFVLKIPVEAYNAGIISVKGTGTLTTSAVKIFTTRAASGGA